MKTKYGKNYRLLFHDLVHDHLTIDIDKNKKNLK